MSLIVQKYGGSSLATPGHIRRAAERIRDLKRSGKDVVVVVSAMGRMTDHLIRLAERTVKRPPQRELDMLMTAGERISMALSGDGAGRAGNSRDLVSHYRVAERNRHDRGSYRGQNRRHSGREDSGRAC